MSLTLATEYLKKSVQKEFCKEFGQKVLDYSRGDISLRKFSTIFLALLRQQNEEEIMNEVVSIIGDTADDQQV